MKEFHEKKNIITIVPVAIELSAVTVSPRPGEQFQAISKIDIQSAGYYQFAGSVTPRTRIIYRATSGGW